jgi:hypothetical protein
METHALNMEARALAIKRSPLRCMIKDGHTCIDWRNTGYYKFFWLAEIDEATMQSPKVYDNLPAGKCWDGIEHCSGESARHE